MSTYTTSHTAENAAKGEAVAEIIGLDLNDAPSLIAYIKECGPTNPASIVIAAAWTFRNPGLFMGTTGIVIQAQNGQTFRTLTAEERAEFDAKEAAYGEGYDA